MNLEEKLMVVSMVALSFAAVVLSIAAVIFAIGALD